MSCVCAVPAAVAPCAQIGAPKFLRVSIRTAKGEMTGMEKARISQAALGLLESPNMLNFESVQKPGFP